MPFRTFWSNGGWCCPAYPSVIPAVFSGNPVSFFLALHSCGPALSCRECRFALSGQTGGGVAPLTPLSFPQFLAGIQCLFFWPFIRADPRSPAVNAVSHFLVKQGWCRPAYPSVIPAVFSGNPESFSSVPSFVRIRALLPRMPFRTFWSNGGGVAPLTPLSFPQFLAGIQSLSFLALHSCGPALPCRECRFALSGQTGDRVAPLTPLSFPQFLAGIQCLSLLALHSCGPALSCRECRFALSGQTGDRVARLPLCHSRSF